MIINDLLERGTGLRVMRPSQFPERRTYRHDIEELTRQALSALEALESSGSHKVTPQQKKTADDYAASVLGSKDFAPWLYVYMAVSGAFKEGWMPDDFYHMRVAKKLCNGMASVSDVKSLSKVILRTKTLPDIAYHIDGIFYGEDLDVIDINKLQSILNVHPFVFAKKDGSGRGVGVTKLSTTEISDETFRQIGNCVIQKPIRQHEFFDNIVEGSVATIRVTTVNDRAGKTAMRASYLRLGRRDTPWVKADNSVRVAIIDRDGTLDDLGYTQDWTRWRAHPDTNVAFRNLQIPEFAKAEETCVSLHAKLPHFKIIGWDISIDERNDVAMIEWNAGHCDVKFTEATTGPHFRDMDWETLGRNS